MLFLWSHHCGKGLPVEWKNSEWSSFPPINRVGQRQFASVDWKELTSIWDSLECSHVKYSLYYSLRWRPSKIVKHFSDILLRPANVPWIDFQFGLAKTICAYLKAAYRFSVVKFIDEMFIRRVDVRSHPPTIVPADECQAEHQSTLPSWTFKTAFAETPFIVPLLLCDVINFEWLREKMPFIRLTVQRLVEVLMEFIWVCSERWRRHCVEQSTISLMFFRQVGGGRF